jgi:hypothetical protein
VYIVTIISFHDKFLVVPVTIVTEREVLHFMIFFLI